MANNKNRSEEDPAATKAIHRLYICNYDPRFTQTDGLVALVEAHNLFHLIVFFSMMQTENKLIASQPFQHWKVRVKERMEAKWRLQVTCEGPNGLVYLDQHYAKDIPPEGMTVYFENNIFSLPTEYPHTFAADPETITVQYGSSH